MKKIISILLLLLMLTSCNRKIDNDIAQIQTEDVKTQQHIDDDEAMAEGDEQVESEEGDVIPSGQSENTATEEQPKEEKPATDEDGEQPKDEKPATDEDSKQPEIEVSDCTQLGDSFKDKPENEQPDLSGLNTSRGGTPLPNEEPIGTTGIYRFKSVEEIIKASDYVVVASPTQTYAEANQYWHNWLMEPVDDYDKLSFSNSFCVRPFKVTEVIKGKDKSLTEINICQNILTNQGQTRIMTGNYPMNPDGKYLIFLYKSDINENQYFPFLFQGVYTFDYVTDAELWQINPTLYDQIEKRFENKIK